MTPPADRAVAEAAQALLHEMTLRDLSLVERVAVLAGVLAATIRVNFAAADRLRIARLAGAGIESLVAKGDAA